MGQLLFLSRALEKQSLMDYFLGLLPQKGNCRSYLITTAASHYKEQNKHNQALYQRLSRVNVRLGFLDVEIEHPSLLKEADVILLGGGNPYYLLHHLKASAADHIIKTKFQEGALIVGISAGGLVLQPSLELIDYYTPEMNTIGLLDKTGLGLINEYVLPHYDRFLEEGIIKDADILNFEKRCGQQVLKLNEKQGIHFSKDAFAWLE